MLLLTRSDLADSGIGGPDQVEAAADEAGGLGPFIRSLVGLDRAAAKDALAAFLDSSTMTANQIDQVISIFDRVRRSAVAA